MSNTAWIPVIKSVPHNDRPVICTIIENKKPHIAIMLLDWSDGTWRDMGGYRTTYIPIAWQPMPEPYKEGMIY